MTLCEELTATPDVISGPTANVVPDRQAPGNASSDPLHQLSSREDSLAAMYLRDDIRKAGYVTQHFKDRKFEGKLEQSIELYLRDYKVCARQNKLSDRHVVQCLRSSCRHVHVDIRACKRTLVHRS